MPAKSTESATAPRRLRACTVHALVEWYGHHARDLPWRRSKDPYRILVSEVMLQQTRVEAVVDRYERFLRRFPALSALAAAKEDDVLSEWSGLGYYRRARNLHALAQVTMQQHGGVLPPTYAALRALPGVGDYTAAAVASIAFDLPHLSIDGNVARVMCRLLDIAGDPGRAAVRRQLRAAAAAALRTQEPGRFNQALMELGALICVPRSPRCQSCPCASTCDAYRRGDQEKVPARRAQTVRAVNEAAVVLELDGRYLVLRGQRPGVLEWMWEFPTVDSRVAAVRDRRNNPMPSSTDEIAEPREHLAGRLRRHLESLQIRVDGLRPLGTIRHSITTRRITCHVFEPEHADVLARSGEGGPTPQIGWYSATELADIPLAASARKILDMIGC